MHVAAGQTTSPWAALLKISYGQLPDSFSADDEINEASSSSSINNLVIISRSRPFQT